MPQDRGSIELSHAYKRLPVAAAGPRTASLCRTTKPTSSGENWLPLTGPGLHFNWRIKRLVTHDLLLRDITCRAVASAFIYSIGSFGALRLQGMGEYYCGPLRGLGKKIDEVSCFHCLLERHPPRSGLGAAQPCGGMDPQRWKSVR